MSIFGGLCPLMISALAVALKPPSSAAGAVVLLSAAVTAGAGMALIRVAPGANAPCPAGEHLEYLAQRAQQQQQQQGSKGASWFQKAAKLKGVVVS
jgi:hypothetical protein